MECQGCFNNFDNEKCVPRILIACGHTLCTQCIQKQLDKSRQGNLDADQSYNKNDTNNRDLNQTNNYNGNKANMIKCIECEVIIQNIESPNQLPINLALLQFSKNQQSNNQASSQNQRQDSPKRSRFEEVAIEKVPKRHRIQVSGFNQGQQVSLCEAHDKKIEAFCDLDKKLLCIDCILNENHKNHEILSLEKACTKEKHVFDMSLKTALQKETEVQHQILRIKNHLYELEESANKNRSEISKIFNEIRNKIIERETNMKKQISDTLEKEQQVFKQRIANLEDQMKCIQDLKDEKIMIDNETILETLIQSPYRFEIEHDANRRIEPIFFQTVFQEIKKDDEITNIVRAIIPSHLRTTLIQNTVSSQIKKKEKQEELKRKEFSKQQAHIPIYDYDHKFNYRKGYLRDDKVPAFISTKQRKEAELDKLVNNSTDIIIESKAMIGIVQKQTSTGQHGKNQQSNNIFGSQQQQLHINTKQANQKSNIAGLGSNDNSPRTQQQIMNNQIQKLATQNFNSAIGSIQNVNQKIQKKKTQQPKHSQNPFDQSQNNESSIAQQLNRPSSIHPQQMQINLDDDQNSNSLIQNSAKQQQKRAISSDRQNQQFQCTLPQSLQNNQKKDSPLQRSNVKKHPSDLNTNRNYEHSLHSNIEERKSVVETPQKSAQKNKVSGTALGVQQQQLNQIFGSFDNKVRAVYKMQNEQSHQNDLMSNNYPTQAPKTHRQSSKGTSNLAEVRSQKKQEKAKKQQQVQLPHPQQLLFGSNMQHQSSIMGTSQISQQNMSTLKKKGKKGKESSYFEFTNEKLFKQIIDKKNPNNTSKVSKTNKSVSKNAQLKSQQKANQVQSSSGVNKQKHTESDQSQNKTNSNQDIERQKSSLDDEMREMIYEEDNSSQKDFDNDSHKVDEEFSQSTNKKRRNPHQHKNKYINKQNDDNEGQVENDDHDDEDEEGHFINDNDFDDAVHHHKISNYQERSKSQSEDLDEEGIPEISSIHNSPQKRQSEIGKGNNRNGSSPGRSYTAHNIPAQSTFNTKKLEDHFDNDQSRINFAPDQNTLNDADKDLVSFRLEFDLSVKHSDTMMESGGGNGQNYREDISLLNQFQTAQIGPGSIDNKIVPNELLSIGQMDDHSKAQLASQSSMTIDFDNLFKMKEEYIFVFSGFNERFLTSVEVFDVTRGIWREFKDACPNRAKFQVQALNDESILVFGGKDEFGIQMDDVEDFGIKEMKTFPGDWRLPHNVSGFSSCMIKPGVIAVCGGNTGTNISNKFYMIAYKSIKAKSQRIEHERHNIPQITEMPPMNIAREEFALVLGPDHKLYAIGGYNPQDGCISTVEAFDFQKQQWEIVTEMEEGKRALNAVALPDGIYVLGGYNGKDYLNTVQKYDISSNKWCNMRGMNTNRGTFSTLVSQNCNYIYAIGGFNGQPLDHVERYDAMHNQWEYLAPMKQKRFMHAACITNIEKKK